MKILLAYVFVVGGRASVALANRFVATYQQHPPGVDHDLVVICNGAPYHAQRSPGKFWQSPGNFHQIKHYYFPRSDLAWDIGGYQELAAKADVNMMVCCGESTYFYRRGWLARLAEAYEKNGPGIYGSFSSYLVRPHLNTTGFAIGPEFLRGWPTLIRTRQDRYGFEHGEHSIWRRIAALGKPAKLVTWDGEYDMAQWREPPNILWRGDQSNCLMFCKHTDRYFAASEEVKERWSAGADGRVEAKPEFQTA